MILLNFSHPLSNEHLAQTKTLAGNEVDRVIEVNSQINAQESIVQQVAAMADRCGLSPVEWQTLPILVNPPSLHWVAVTLVAEIHGRCGYFPPVVRLRSVDKGLTQEYEVAEIINLQRIRDEARQKRR